MAHSSCSANGSLSVSCLWEGGGRGDPRGSSQGGKGLGAAVSATSQGQGDSAGGGAAGSLCHGCPIHSCPLRDPLRRLQCPCSQARLDSGTEALKACGLGAQWSCLSVRRLCVNSSREGRGSLLPSNQRQQFSISEKPVLGRRCMWGGRRRGLGGGAVSSKPGFRVMLSQP